jgi:hypothetical protein
MRMFPDNNNGSEFVNKSVAIMGDTLRWPGDGDVSYSNVSSCREI